MNVRRPTLFHLVMMMCLLGNLAFAQALAKSSPGRPMVAQSQPVIADQSRADEWKRREVLESQYGRSPFETHVIGYVEIIVVPLLVFLLILGVVRMRNF